MVLLAAALSWMFASAALAADAPAPQPKAAAKKAPAKKAPAKKGAAAKSAPKTPVEAAVAMEGPEVRDFRAFCDSWMQKLRDRETYNTANIKWETRDGRVSGEYLAYNTDCTCSAREEAGKDPIGKITYRETKYRREGATQTEAMAGTPTMVEQSDVTEIFRFAKGHWIY